MISKSISFDDKQINKSNFYKNKNLFKIYDIDANKILISKKDLYDKKSHLNTLLNIVKMMTLDHYL